MRETTTAAGNLHCPLGPNSFRDRFTLSVHVPKIVGFQGPKTNQSMDFGTYKPHYLGTRTLRFSGFRVATLGLSSNQGDESIPCISLNPKPETLNPKT